MHIQNLRNSTYVILIIKVSKPVSKKQGKVLHLDKEAVQKCQNWLSMPSKPCTFQTKSLEIKMDRCKVADIVSSPSQTVGDIKDKSKISKDASKRSYDILKNDHAPKTSVSNVSDIRLHTRDLGEGSSLPSPRRSKRIKSINEPKAPTALKKEEEPKQNELYGKGRNSIITQIQMTNLLWRELLSRDYEVEIGQVVCAKMATYWPWPAIVTGFNRNRAVVKFFGDMKQGSVPKLQCVPFYHCHKVIFHYVNSIDKKTKEKWRENKSESLEIQRESIIRKMSMKELYMQALRDVEIYLNSPNSLILSIL